MYKLDTHLASAIGLAWCITFGALTIGATIKSVQWVLELVGVM